MRKVGLQILSNKGSSLLKLIDAKESLKDNLSGSADPSGNEFMIEKCTNIVE